MIGSGETRPRRLARPRRVTKEASPFVLINLEAGQSFLFDFFPAHIQIQSRSNWEAQDTTIGTKPLFYGNHEPRRVTIDEIYMDLTDEGLSIKQDVDDLLALQQETVNGTPAALLAVWGDHRLRCVLEEVTIDEQWFDQDGTPQRAKVSLQLVELQPLTGVVTSAVMQIG